MRTIRPVTVHLEWDTPEGNVATQCVTISPSQLRHLLTLADEMQETLHTRRPVRREVQ